MPFHSPAAAMGQKRPYSFFSLQYLYQGIQSKWLQDIRTIIALYIAIYSILYPTFSPKESLNES